MSYEKNKRTHQDFILLIMNCKKYKHKASFQRKTWLINLPSSILYYHVIGDPTITEKYIFKKCGDGGNVLYVKCEDDYNSLPQKVIRSFQAIYETYDFKYIFKTDDDQMMKNCLFFTTLVNILYQKEKMVHYGGNIITVDNPYYSMYNKIHPELPDNIIIKPTKYCNGRFYFLSNGSINYLLKQKELIEKEYIEDWAIGFHLHSILKTNALMLKTDAHFTDFEKTREFIEYQQQQQEESSNEF